MAQNNAINKSMPLPCFMARISANIANATGDGTIAPVTYNEIIFDNIPGSFDIANKRYVAPKTGYYFLTYSALVSSLGAAMTYGYLTLTTTTTVYYSNISNLGACRNSSNQFMLHSSNIVYLSVGNTASISVVISGSTKTAGFDTTSVAIPETYFSGYLIR